MLSHVNSREFPTSLFAMKVAIVLLILSNIFLRVFLYLLSKSTRPLRSSNIYMKLDIPKVKR